MDQERELGLVPVDTAGAMSTSVVVVDDEPLYLAWETAREAWLESKRRLSGGENTVSAYSTAFRQFFDWAAIPPWKISPKWAQDWHTHLVKEGLAKASVALKLAALSSFYDFVQRRYVFQNPEGREVALWPADRRNPFDAVERPKVSPYGRAKFPTVEEAKAILAAINTKTLTGKRDFALLFTFMVTCRRASEILNLRWGDLQELGDGSWAFHYRYKGGEERRAVLPRVCYQAICANLMEDGRPPGEMTEKDSIWLPLYPDRIKRLPQFRDQRIDPNQPIGNTTANRVLKKYGLRVGVDEAKLHLHALRHVGARHRLKLMKMGQGGIDLTELKELLGHSSLAVTQIYLEVVGEDPEDSGGDAAAAELLPKGARRRKKKPAGEQLALGLAADSGED